MNNKVNLYGEVTIDQNVEDVRTEETEVMLNKNTENFHMDTEETNVENYIENDNDYNYDDYNYNENDENMNVQNSQITTDIVPLEQIPTPTNTTTSATKDDMTMISTNNSLTKSKDLTCSDIFRIINPVKSLLPLSYIQTRIKAMLNKAPNSSLIR